MTVRATSILLLAGLALAVAGCGRKAPLDSPYEAAVAARKKAEQDKKMLPPEPQAPAKERRFILDSLI